MKKCVTVPYDPGKTSPLAMTEGLRKNFDIMWYECATCHTTSGEPAEHHGKPMERKP